MLNPGSSLFSWRLRWKILIEIFKVTLASGLSYAVASTVVGNNHGYFAPLASILIMQGSVAESLTRAVQRILGVIVGVMASLFFVRYFGVNTLGITLMVGISLLLGHQLRLGATGTPQVAVSALLIMIVGSLTHGYWWERIYETVIGAVIGAFVNALLLPPSYLPEAQLAVSRFAGRLSKLMLAFAACLAQTGGGVDAKTVLLRARKANDQAKDVRVAINRASESLRFNINREQQAELLRHEMVTAEMLERVSVTARMIARQLADRASAGEPYGVATEVTLQAQLFTLCGRYLAALEQPQDTDPEILVDEMEALIREADATRNPLAANLRVIVDDVHAHYQRARTWRRPAAGH